MFRRGAAPREARRHFHRRFGRRLHLRGIARWPKTSVRTRSSSRFMPDTGMRYLSKVYNDEWMRERGYVEAAVHITAADVVNAKHQAGKVRELVIARPYQTVFHALKTMQEQDISQIPVFEENIPIGTIYEDQILTMALQGKDLRKLVVREVMSKPLPRIPGSSPVERVTYILEPRKSRRLRRNGRRKIRNPHQIRFDEHRRQPHGTEALSADLRK